jgi:predicted RNA-binding Zn-ribbon protein involved in translation (DUF1610 family)
MVFCKSCGAEIADVINTKYCPKCGYLLAGQNSATMAAGYNPYKNPTTAALIAIIGGIPGFLGIGHIYTGNTKRDSHSRRWIYSVYARNSWRAIYYRGYCWHSSLDYISYTMDMAGI